MPDTYITIPTEKGTIRISEDVVGAIASTAIAEVDGVAGMSGAGAAELSELIGKRSVSRGVHVSVDQDRVEISAAILVYYGKSISAVAEKVQKAVNTAVESMTGLKCSVNVHVAGVAFEK